MTFERYISKKTLYTTVDKKIRSLGITHSDYPLDSIKIAKMFEPNIIIEYHKFKSFSICGMLYKGNNISTIYLNSLRSCKGHNFDCMHELVHYWFHNPADIICCDKSISQHKGREWQANEAAAQALMPVDLFLKKHYEYNGDRSKLSDFFYVGETSIDYRIKNLTTEISEYSKPKLCSNCKSIILPNTIFCRICGSNNFYKGDKHMHYNDGFNLDDNSRALNCPRCSNEDIDYEGDYCNICGTYLVNKCNNNYHCGSLCEGNARYCYECGGETTFFTNGILKSWDEVNSYGDAPKLELFFDWTNAIKNLKTSGRMMLVNYLAASVAYKYDNVLFVAFPKDLESFKGVVNKPEYIDAVKSAVRNYIRIKDVRFVDEDWLREFDLETVIRNTPIREVRKLPTF